VRVVQRPLWQWTQDLASRTPDGLAAHLRSRFLARIDGSVKSDHGVRVRDARSILFPKRRRNPGILALQLRYDPIGLRASSDEHPRNLQQLRHCRNLSRHGSWSRCGAVAQLRGACTSQQERATEQSQNADFATHQYCYIIT
jgi:hypothetical protein